MSSPRCKSKTPGRVTNFPSVPSFLICRRPNIAFMPVFGYLARCHWRGSKTREKIRRHEEKKKKNALQSSTINTQRRGSTYLSKAPDSASNEYPPRPARAVSHKRPMCIVSPANPVHETVVKHASMGAYQGVKQWQYGRCSTCASKGLSLAFSMHTGHGTCARTLTVDAVVVKDVPIKAVIVPNHLDIWISKVRFKYIQHSFRAVEVVNPQARSRSKVYIWPTVHGGARDDAIADRTLLLKVDTCPHPPTCTDAQPRPLRHY